ncbi:Carbon-nitrogen hydrolase, variant 2 [Orbilia oligospora]|uniref:Carbon-nitrogen hydrolase n=1 Tax=Orbilia oligospora TaxID=2813651 RepID=A0A7C8VBB5_ORBOL|nr:Carbon-nitrogen hydrolase [Orbilia oligospora]KAF3275692.1 Carbon-nitrogen hydrolase, variant 2 [Orbilia oligospora]
MKIACLQFDPQIGKVQDNIHKADEILGNVLGTEDIQEKVDVLVLPELAFTGYVFDSKASIRPYLERTTSGISTQWAQQTSRRLRCYTVVGYPELANEYRPPSRYPRVSDPFSETSIDTTDEDNDDDTIQNYCYNACVVTSPDGEVLMNYRKTFLYVTDECWASEGSCFGTTTFTFPTNPTSPTSPKKEITVALGICMDLNPYKFEAPFEAYEFANHIISSGAQLAIVPMAWETKDPYDDSRLQRNAKVMHHSTVNYWSIRLEPLFGTANPESEGWVRTDKKTVDGTDWEWEYLGDDKWGRVYTKEQEKLVFVTCNRTGRENGTLFMGSSVIMSIKKKSVDAPRCGNLENYQAMGIAEEGLMIAEVDI